jgi:hypothetical protein
MKYTAKFKQPQTVGSVKLDPRGGDITGREYKALKKDAYGASLLEKGLVVVEGQAQTAPGETVPDFDTGSNATGKKR